MKDCYDQAQLIKKLNRVTGQLEAVKRMVQDDKVPCEDIMIQINAADGGLHQIGLSILEGHLSHCVRAAIEAGEAEKALANYKKSLEQYFKIR